MAISAAVTERDAVDLLVSSIICGAHFDDAVDLMVGFMSQEGMIGPHRGAPRSYYRSGKPYTPRHDPNGWTPRLPEKEWWPLRGQVFRRDGHLCNYCKDEDGPFEVDHIIPVTRGGSHDLTNLCVACKPCNSSKGDRLLSEWRGRYR